MTTALLAGLKLTAAERGYATLLIEERQLHLFEGWDAGGDYKAFFTQIKALDEAYPGGLKAYLASARTLLAASAKGENPLEGWLPSVPSGERLDFGSEVWEKFEGVGLGEVSKCCFVLVAGGLGERLGYSRIKVELPTETVTKCAYLRYYVEMILALQRRSGAAMIPLAIMVSEDTDLMTRELLAANDNFGAAEGQITLLKQGKVPALLDNDAKMARDGVYGVQGKPHGHGDVHVLLHSSGLVKEWAEEGKAWVYFFQDTNALGFRPLVPMLGISKTRGMHCNFLTVPRLPGQAVGGIVKLTKGKECVTLNVEYNQLDPLLRATVSPEGDVAGDNGLSPYPGNINQFVLACGPYAKVLERTRGVMAEFVNPKYADSTKSVFKKPARLECMMQDYPKVLSGEDVVGFTSTESWLAFSPCKNNATDALKASPPACALTAESDQYFHCVKMMQAAGCLVETASEEETWLGLSTTKLSPSLVLSPAFSCSFIELKTKFPDPEKVKISSASTLVLDGDGIVVKSLDLKGGLVVRATPDAQITVVDCVCHNPGFKRGGLDESAPESLRIRGYDTTADEQVPTFDLKGPGTWTVSTVDGKVVATKQ